MIRFLMTQWNATVKYRHALPRTAVIYPTAFCVSFGMGLLILGLNFHIRDVFHATGSQVGILFALYSVCYIFGCLVIRPWTDKVPPRYLILIACVLIATMTGGICYAKSMTTTIFLYASFGLSISIFWPPLMSWLSADAESAALNRIMSRFNISWSVAGIISQPVTGWLSSIKSTLPMIVASCLFFLVTIMLALAVLLLPRLKETVQPQKPSADLPIDDGLGTRFRWPSWVGSFTAYVTLGVIMYIFPFAARDALQLSKQTVSWITFVRSAAMTAGFIMMGRTIFWHYRTSFMIICQTALAACAIAMIFADRPIVISGIFVLIGMCVASAYFESLFHGSARASVTRRTARMATHESLLSAGSITGSLVGGYLYQHRTTSYLYGFCALTMLIGITLQGFLCAWANRHERNR